MGAPLERVAMDILGPLPVTERGNRYVLVIGDYFTKWVESGAYAGGGFGGLNPPLWYFYVCKPP